MRYSTILADPPWNEKGGGKIKRGADRHYPLLKTEQIMALPIQQFAEPNAHLYLWTTNNHLPDALRVMEAWGFTYKTMITWAKDRMGIGQYFRGMTEHVLFGVQGNIPYRFKADGKRAQGRTLITAPKGAHSEKPEELRAMIQIVSPGPYLELFAREKAPGWDAWGNEVRSDITMPGLWGTVEDPAYTCPHCGGHNRNERGSHLCPPDLMIECGNYGCKNMKSANSVFCKNCAAEYREDPDAFK